MFVQAEGWMVDKLQTARDEQFTTDVKDLQDKMKKLQKHQAFEAEIVANTDRINAITEVGQAINWNTFFPSLNSQLSIFLDPAGSL